MTHIVQAGASKPVILPKPSFLNKTNRTSTLQLVRHRHLSHDLYDDLKSEMDKGVLLSVKKHKSMMTLAIQNKFLTISDIRVLHDQYTSLIIEAFKYSFTVLDPQNSAHSNVKQAFMSKLSVLNIVLETQFLYYVSMSEHYISLMVNKAGECRLEAEQFYSTLMINQKEKLRNSQDLNKVHDLCYDKVVGNFTESLKQIGLVDVHNWLPELEFNLYKKFEQFQSRLSKDWAREAQEYSSNEVTNGGASGSSTNLKRYSEHKGNLGTRPNSERNSNFEIGDVETQALNEAGKKLVKRRPSKIIRFLSHVIVKFRMQNHR